MDVMYFLERNRKIQYPFVSWNRAEQGGKHVKNLEIFWMNNKTIIEFGFRMMWKII